MKIRRIVPLAILVAGLLGTGAAPRGADPAGATPRQQAIAARYQRQMNAVAQLAPAGFGAYFEDALGFLRAADPLGEERRDDLLFTLLIAEVVPLQLHARNRAEDGAAWREFVRAEIDRRLPAATEPREREILLALDAAVAGTEARPSGAAVEKLDVFAQKLDALHAQFPQSPTLVPGEGRCLELLEKRDPGRALARARRLAAGENEAVATIARGRLEVAQGRLAPLQMKFRAVDGREVDLAQLRGKVVLIDFWATWCGPCVAELPALKKVYAAYRDRGFEIVGITAENARLAPDDTPAQAAAKLAAAKKVLTDFTTRNELPWPQYFDGAFWHNPLFKQYAITGIPALFLLDREGRLVSSDVRGERLESEVRRLLGLGAD